MNDEFPCPAPARRQFRLSQLFMATAWIALTLGVWLPDTSQLASRHDVVAVLIVLARLAICWLAVMAVGRYVPIFPRFMRHLPLEIQVFAGLTVLLIMLVAASILLPAIH